MLALIGKMKALKRPGFLAHFLEKIIQATDPAQPPVKSGSLDELFDVANRASFYGRQVILLLDDIDAMARLEAEERTAFLACLRGEKV